MSKDFVRQDSVRHLKLGKRKKKLRTWRKPKGRDSKMRLSRKSYPKTVSVGYKTQKTQSGKIKGMTPVLVHNLNDLKKVDKNSIVILARIGAKKKLEIIKAAQESKIKILNLTGAKK